MSLDQGGLMYRYPQQHFLGDREVERMHSALSTPHPAEWINLGFGNMVDQDQQILTYFEIAIFTDGSKIAGKVGAALFS